ncbi:TSUP family transporter [Micromonospora sp. NPDC004336]
MRRPARRDGALPLRTPPLQGPPLRPRLDRPANAGGPCGVAAQPSVFGDIDWRGAAILVPATVLGGYAGARLLRRLPGRLLRLVVVTFGTVFGLVLLWRNLL